MAIISQIPEKDIKTIEQIMAEIEEQERKINLYKKSGLEIFLGW